MLPSLIETLAGSDEADLADALYQLASMMDTLYGADVEALCELLRISGSVNRISSL